LVPLGDPLLCHADVEAQRLGVLEFRLAALIVERDGLLGNVVDPLLRHRLREELHIVGDVQDLHLLHPAACAGSPAGAIGPPVRHLVADLVGHGAGVPEVEAVVLPGPRIVDRKEEASWR
jgi:hypothetical protein